MEAENPSSATQPTSQCLEIPKERLSKNTFDKSGLIEGAKLAFARAFRVGRGRGLGVGVGVGLGLGLGVGKDKAGAARPRAEASSAPTAWRLYVRGIRADRTSAFTQP